MLQRLTWVEVVGLIVIGVCAAFGLGVFGVSLAEWAMSPEWTRWRRPGHFRTKRGQTE